MSRERFDDRGFCVSALVGLFLVLVIGIAPAKGQSGPVSTIDDFDSGIPFAPLPLVDPVGIFTFGGDDDDHPILSDVASDRPGAAPGNRVMQVVYDINIFGGFVHNLSFDTDPRDWSAFEGFRFWFRGNNSGDTIQMEIKDGGANAEASELWEVFFVDDFDGWKLVSFRFSDFVRRTSFQPPGAPNDGNLDLTQMWGYAFGLPIGTGPGSFLLDQVEVFQQVITLEDFEGDIPFGFPVGIFTFGGDGDDNPTLTAADLDLPALGLSPNQVLQVDYDINIFGGLVQNLSFDSDPQDWSGFEGIRFWFFGTNMTPLPPGSGRTIQFEIKDGGVNAEASELWEFFFTDDFAGWTEVVIPFSDFRLRTSFQPTGGPINATLDLTEMWGYAFGLPIGSGPGSFSLDHVQVFGFAPDPVQAVVDFSRPVYLADEGDTATVEVVLETTDGEPITAPITATVTSTEEGSAQVGDDYAPVSETLVFDAGTPSGTAATVSVTTVSDGVDEFAETIALSLTLADDGQTVVGGNSPANVVINAHGFAYLDPDRSVRERVNDLISRMTVEEKVGQMTLVEQGSLIDAQDIATFQLGALLSGGGSAPTPNTPEAWADLVDGYQARALQTRLQIPVLYGVDAVHGHNNVVGATLFPHNIGLGASRNPDLVRQIAEITAKEVYATGIPWDYSPCLCVTRDIRWGRTYESFGEHPDIATMMASSIDGYQGDDLSAPNTVLATAKHWIGDGGTTFGSSATGAYTIDQGITELTEPELRAIHVPPFIEAIERGVASIMPSYSSVDFLDGEGPLKMHAHDYLNNVVLKGELGFDGFIVSDWQAIDQIPGPYDVVEGPNSSDVEIGINAGIDLVMVPNAYQLFIRTLLGEVAQGDVPMARIDDALDRILTKKFELGLFERPFSDRTEIGSIGSPEHRAVARQAVRESLVLLKDDDYLLPLAEDARVYVAGKNADNIGHQSGGWSIAWQGGSGDITPGTTILDGIEAIAGGSGPVTFSEDASAPTLGHDIGIVVVGETPYTEGFGDIGNVEQGRFDLLLDQADQNAIAAVCGDLPCVVVIVSGRPMIITDLLPDIDVLVAAWLPGTEGDGVAEVLFGRADFRGTLPVSWPRSMDQIPINVPVRIGDDDDDDGDDDDDDDERFDRRFVQRVAHDGDDDDGDDDDGDFGSQTYDPLFAFGFGLRHGFAHEIEIDGCSTGVRDAFTDAFGRPQFISDAIGQCVLDSSRHSAFVSCVGDVTSELRRAEVISRQDRRAIRSCASRADLP